MPAQLSRTSIGAEPFDAEIAHHNRFGYMIMIMNVQCTL